MNLLQGITNPAELFFLVDTSKDVPENLLGKMRDFVKKQGQVYNSSLDKARFSLVSYADRPTTILAINKGTSMTALSNALKRVRKADGQRQVGKALMNIKDVIVNERDGVRPTAGKVVVLMVAGKDAPSDLQRMKLEAEALARAGVNIVVIGIGSDVDEAVLKLATTNPDNVVKLKFDNQLLDAVAPVSKAVSTSVRDPSPLDVGFIIGAEGSDAVKDFNLQKDITKRLLDRLDIASDKSRIGLIVYGSDVRVRVRLDSDNDRNSAKKLVHDLRMPRPGFALARAIAISERYLFAEGYGARKGVHKVAIVFVNRDVDTPSKSAASKLLAKGIRVVAVAVGRMGNIESVKDIASSGKDVVKIASADDIQKGTEKALLAVLPSMYCHDLCFTSLEIEFSKMSHSSIAQLQSNDAVGCSMDVT